MNNGKRIRELQNNEENIRLLAAQRQTYSDAKHVDHANACICLLLPFVITVVQQFVDVSSRDLVLVWIATMVAGICLPKRAELLIDEAARMQQRFDSAVFGIKFDNVSRDDGKIATRAKRYFNNCNRKREGTDLDDWYSADISSMTSGDAIARCQRQNTEWTKRLLRRSLCIETSIGILAAIMTIALIRYSGVDPLNLFFLFSIIEWMIQRVVRCREVLKSVNSLADSLSEYRLSSRENILRVQEKIFEYRRAPYLVPNLLYAIFKGYDDAATAG